MPAKHEFIDYYFIIFIPNFQQTQLPNSYNTYESCRVHNSELNWFSSSDSTDTPPPQFSQTAIRQNNCFSKTPPIQTSLRQLHIYINADNKIPTFEAYIDTHMLLSAGQLWGRCANLGVFYQSSRAPALWTSPLILAGSRLYLALREPCIFFLKQSNSKIRGVF